MKDEDGIKRHPFLQQLETNDEDALFQRPPALLRMGTMLVALALLGLLVFVAFIQVRSSVPISLVAEESFTSTGFSDNSCATGISGSLSLQAFGYLSEIGSVRVGQAVLIQRPLCTGGLCLGREGVIVSITPESRVQQVLVRVRLQRALESDSVPELTQQNGRKISGRILTRDLFLREPFSTIGEWFIRQKPSPGQPKL